MVLNSSLSTISDDESPLIHGIESPARSLASLGPSLDSSVVRFVVGTLNSRPADHENYVHLIEYQEESHSLSKLIFKHDGGEIWHISSSPAQSDLVCTVHRDLTSGVYKSTLWRIPIDLSLATISEEDSTSLNTSSPGHGSEAISSLEKVAEFGVSQAGEKMGKCSLFKPEEGSSVITFDSSSIKIWDVAGGSHEASRSIPIQSPSLSKYKTFGQAIPLVNVMKWSPHSNASILGLTMGGLIYGLDMRLPSESQYVWCLPGHNGSVRDIDFNPNAQYVLASAGDDCESRFWDIRNPSRPSVSLRSHSHWIWSIRFNQFHDQLVLTASSDSHVVLSRVSSLASQPFGHELLGDLDNLSVDQDSVSRDRVSNGSTQIAKSVDGDTLSIESRKSRTPSAKEANDKAIASFEEHEDSVYCAEWSTADPWVFSSLSYDGRLIVNKVPKSEKLNILF